MLPGRPETPDGVISVVDLLKDPEYVEVFNKSQKDPQYSHSWNDILATCAPLKSSASLCAQGEIGGLENPRCKAIVQRWFVCAAKQIQPNVYDRFLKCMKVQNEIENCVEEYDGTKFILFWLKKKFSVFDLC